MVRASRFYGRLFYSGIVLYIWGMRAKEIITGTLLLTAIALTLLALLLMATQPPYIVLPDTLLIASIIVSLIGALTEVIMKDPIDTPPTAWWDDVHVMD